VSSKHHQYRFVYLLAAQLGVIVLAPFIAGDRPRPGLFTAFALALFAAALWAVAAGRRLRIVAALLAAPAIAANMITLAVPQSPAQTPAILFGLLFLVFVTVMILRGVLMSAAVTTDTLYGAVTGYLLLGLTWGWAYGLLDQFLPGSFRSLTKEGRLVGPEFTFFSFITLTSVGYGDIIPVNAHARSLAVLEAITGQMYLAVFIARLVGLHGRREKPTSP
jgi:amino acid transporter